MRRTVTEPLRVNSMLPLSMGTVLPWIFSTQTGYLRKIRFSSLILVAAPPIWNVLMVSCVPGWPMDWAAMMPTASPISTGLYVARFRP